MDNTREETRTETTNSLMPIEKLPDWQKKQNAVLDDLQKRMQAAGTAYANKAREQAAFREAEIKSAEAVQAANIQNAIDEYNEAIVMANERYVASTQEQERVYDEAVAAYVLAIGRTRGEGLALFGLDYQEEVSRYSSAEKLLPTLDSLFQG